ncbi:hypothetical protein MMC28_008360, partial [Mycoblastus sanguinarius]|nr:hypothetical protein [Mycoblastus sanguinarius]
MDTRFRPQHGDAFTVWVNANPTHHGITFDEALAMNGLDPSESGQDPNPFPHITVRLSTATPRAANYFYTLHWRPVNGPIVSREYSEMKSGGSEY